MICYTVTLFSSQINEGKFDFFPLLHARCLEREEDETAKQLEALRTMVTSVLERFKEEVYYILAMACWFVPFLPLPLCLQEYEKAQRYRRQEQEKWEEKVLKGRGSFSGSISVEEPPSLPFTH